MLRIKSYVLSFLMVLGFGLGTLPAHAGCKDNSTYMVSTSTGYKVRVRKGCRGYIRNKSRSGDSGSTFQDFRRRKYLRSSREYFGSYVNSNGYSSSYRGRSDFYR